MESLLLALTLLLCAYFDYSFVWQTLPHSIPQPPSLSSSSTSSTSNNWLSGHDLLASISRVAATGSAPSNCRIAIGYNSNLDVIADALPLLTSLDINNNDIAGVDHAVITDYTTMAQSFLHHYQTGSAGERFVSDKDVFHRIVASSLLQPNAIEATGGNAALMANKLASQSCSVLLGGPVGVGLKRLLHHDIQLSSATLEEVDQVHLILEYKAGSTWGRTTTPRANRYILTSDDTNSKLLGAEPFHAALMTFNADCVILSGFHILEGGPASYRSQRLVTVVDQLLSSLGSGVRPRLHVELASMADATYVRELLDILLPHVDSLGLNEQELGTAYVALGGRTFTPSQLSSKIPDKDSVTAVLQLIMSTYGAGALTRVHFHSLAFHIIATRRGSRWGNAFAAVAMGSLTATAQACDSLANPLSLTNDDVDQLISWPQSQTVHSWSADDIDYVMVPVVVCRSPSKTVGLGDAISSMGLLYHLSP